MPAYMVTVQSSGTHSGKKKGYLLIIADSATEARKRAKEYDVTVEGMGGKFRTVSRVLKVERIHGLSPGEEKEGWV